ncbi:uncharacterized protein plx [Epargyreus clarus]|uniref:uncharacterized protein plx n=1 Tax=Epargyreus clarus TaxID=520877 RepID=UPI003C301A9A
MKTKLTSVTYLGYTAMDRRFSSCMLPWLLREIRATRTRDKLSIAVEEGCLKAYNGNFEPVIVHRLVDILRASQVPGRPEELFYILLNEKEGLLQCYLFRASTVVEVTDLFSQMRDPASGASTPKGSTHSLNNVTRNIGFQHQNGSEHLPWNNPAIALTGNSNTNLTTDATPPLVRSLSNASALTSLCADLSPSDSHFFEVLYIGKVRISQRKVPETLIDDALHKFAQHEAEKIKNQRRHSLLSSTGTSLDSTNSSENINTLKPDNPTFVNNIHPSIIPSTTPLEPDKRNTWKSAENIRQASPGNEVDKEFDKFSKERVEKNTIIKTPTQVPLEPSVLVLNVPKNNLGTVKEEKTEDIHSVISETASSITQFCQTNIKRKETNDIVIKESNPFIDDLKDKKESNVDPLLHIPVKTKIEFDAKYVTKTDDKQENIAKINGKQEIIAKTNDVQENIAKNIAKINDKQDNNVKFNDKQENMMKNVTKTDDKQDNIVKTNDKQVNMAKNVTKTDEKQENITKIVTITDDKQEEAEKMDFKEIPIKPMTVPERLLGNEMKKGLGDNKPFLRDRSASIGTLTLKTPIAQVIGEQNRTMLFQVGRSELRLISPDRKQILLHRAFKDVASCVLGRSNKEHFGFVCRETNDTCACYVFKCESDEVASEVVSAIRQAFVAHAEFLKKSREKSPNMSCEHCPMLWYHRLCHDIEGMNEKKTHAFILRRIEQLPDDEQELIITKYQGGTNHMYEVSEHNAFLMMLLRAHCEGKQQRHVHDTAENRSEFLNQYLGGSTIFMKAKRSLSSGFDQLLKRKAHKDELSPQPTKKETSPCPPPLVLETSSEPSPDLLTPDTARCKSLSPAVPHNPYTTPPKSTSLAPDETEEVKDEGTPVTSPMMDIFLKVSDSRPPATEGGSEPDTTWRQTIYEMVVQPHEVHGEGDLNSQTLLGRPQSTPGKRTREQLRELWKMAIDQTILLVRMERENARLKESEESSAVRRIKLEYSELGACDAGVCHVWDSLLARDASQPAARVDTHMLTQAVRQGVPRMSRGGVWYFLAEQASLRSPPPDVKQFPQYHTSYHTLLAGLTKHQHAILIDLGRTFPKHSYFASALGPGQLALYNILKAYSLLDPDVGYCQGLSFVAGVLLLHMEEAEAFILLRHLMFRRGLRKQYLPDMSALQVQLYQLSRLLRDHEPELHARLEALDISPALYAAPWMLTLFTSQFPLGFVVRVFDLIFLESLDVVFAVSLALLSVHKDGLMLCESCEEAAEYLKHKLPDMDKIIYDKVMKKVQKLEISRQLSDYAVEYAVLREEMPRLAALTDDNRQLLADRARMLDELDSAMDAITNYQKTQARLETQNKLMEQHLTILSRYITTHYRQDMPVEVKKIVHNYSKKLSFSSKIGFKFTSNEEEEERKVKTGVSAPNLFSKVSREEVLNAAKVAEDRKQFLMKKSQSVHSGLIANKAFPMKILEEKGEPEPRRRDSLRIETIANESLKEVGKKTSGFFANTHEQIRQERFFEQQLKHDFDENLKKLDEKLSPKTSPRLSPKSYLDDLNIFQGKRSMSLSLNHISKPQESKNDSGFVTPMSPNENEKDSGSVISHPLSDCDVDIKFDGQSTKLKQIRPLKHNGSALSDNK